MSGFTSGFLGAGGFGLVTGGLWFLLEMTARFAYWWWTGARPPADYLLFLAYYSLAGFAGGVLVFALRRIATRNPWLRSMTPRTTAAQGLVLAALATAGILWVGSTSGVDPGVARGYLGAALVLGSMLALGAWGLVRWRRRYGARRLLVYGGGAAVLLLAGHLVLLRASALDRLLDPDPASSPAGGRPNVLLVTIDTLRADRLHAYGYRRQISPEMDRLAGEGALFERAVAHSPWTQPSFASLLTSTYPSQHGSFVVLAPPPAGDQGQTETVLYQSVLQDDAVTVAELFVDQGYSTLAVQPLCIDQDRQRFDQGFQVYLCDSQFVSSMWRKSLLGLGITGVARWLGDRGSRRYQGGLAPADEVYRTLRALISRVLPQPFFLWVNFRDPHSPYLRRQDGVPIGEARVVDALRPEDASIPTPALSEAYDDEVRFVDHYVGRVLDLLRHRGVLDDTAVVLTSDHGEEFDDHFAEHRSAAGTMRGRAHGHSFYSELLHVPLMIRYPPRIPPGTRVGALARHVDLLPTLLDLAGIDVASSGVRFEGKSLVPLMTGAAESEAPRLAFSERNLFGPQRRSIEDGRYKLILEVDSGKVELYDLVADPEERQNLAAARPAEVERLSDLLGRFSAAGGPAPPRSPEVDSEAAEALERLRALGYVE